MDERSDDFISMFLDAEVDGHRLTNDDVLDIGYLFFLAGLDTVTASLDCMFAYLRPAPRAAPAHRRGSRRSSRTPSRRCCAGRPRCRAWSGSPPRTPRSAAARSPRASVGHGHARLGQHRRAQPGTTSTTSTSTVRPTATSPSAAAPTGASARTWPAWSCGWRSRSGTA